jgi:hypothetical protein
MGCLLQHARPECGPTHGRTATILHDDDDNIIDNGDDNHNLLSFKFQTRLLGHLEEATSKMLFLYN